MEYDPLSVSYLFGRLKYIAYLLLISCSVCLTPQKTSAEFLRCQGETEIMGTKQMVNIDILLPVEQNLVLSLLEKEHGELDSIIGALPVGKGVIEVRIGIGESERNVLIVTRMLSRENALIGFFVDRTYVHTIRVDCWKEGCPFFYYDPFWNKFIKGSCNQ